LASFKNDSLENRVSNIIGKELFQRAVDINAEDKKIAVKGYLFHPIDSRHSQTTQKTFINGRIVTDKTVSLAIKESYKNLIPSGRFAITLLFISIDPFYVDVNVSPTKSEIRFRDSSYVKKFLIQAITKSIAKFDRIAVEIDLPIKSDILTQNDKIEEYIKDDTTDQQISQAEHIEPILKTPIQTTVVKDHEAPGVFGVPVAQILDSYIITVVDDGVFIIDQHAVHEKIMQHKMLESICQENKRFIVKPEVMHLTDAQRDIAKSILPHINVCGFVAEIIQNALIISAIPQIISITEACDFIMDLIESATTEESPNIIDSMQKKIADIAAIEVYDSEENCP
jgi:DNA mismatch repair protein MutL